MFSSNQWNIMMFERYCTNLLWSEPNCCRVILKKMYDLRLFCCSSLKTCLQLLLEIGRSFDVVRNNRQGYLPTSRDYIIDTLRTLWQTVYIQYLSCNKISYEYMPTEAISFATWADLWKIDQFVSRLLIWYGFGMKFCMFRMWYLWWMVCDWS